MSCGLFVEFLANDTPSSFESFAIRDLILPGSRPLIESAVGFHLISEAILGTCTERATIGVLARSRTFVVPFEPISLAFTNFCTC